MSNWFQDTLQTARAQLTDRLGNPFVIGFAVAWMCLNIDVVLTVVGAGEFKEKVAFLKTLDINSRTGFWIPLLAGCLWPFTDLAMSGGAKWIANLKQRIVLGIDREQPIAAKKQKEFFATFTDQLVAKQIEINELLDDIQKISSANQESLQTLRLRHRAALLDSFTLGENRFSDRRFPEPKEMDETSKLLLDSSDLKMKLGSSFNKIGEAMDKAEHEEPDVTEGWLVTAVGVRDTKAWLLINLMIATGLVEETLHQGKISRRFCRTSEAWGFLQALKVQERLTSKTSLFAHTRSP